MNTILSDQPQRELALIPNRSFIVQAPAGSGKTELLIQRFLKLLTLVQSPEEILVITFTRKATAEMRTRILQTLNAANHPLAKKVIERDKKLNWQLLKNPNRLSIQTIDAFCTHLTRQMPITSQLGTPLQISDDPEQLYKQAAIETLYHNKIYQKASQQLLRHLDNQLSNAVELLKRMLAKRDQWLHHVIQARNKKTLRKILEQGLQSITNDALEQCFQTFPKTLSREIKILTTFAATHTLNIQEFDFEKLSKDDKNRWLNLALFLLTNENRWRKNATKLIGFPSATAAKNSQEKLHYQTMKKRFEALLQTLNDHENFRDALIEIKHIPPTHYHEQPWKTLNALLELLPIAVAQLKLAFFENGETDYTEIALAAITALGEQQKPTNLALALDYRIQHILVDEFQDTSLSQFHLLEKLTQEWTDDDDRTLFLVGDPMQSIYRFRDAEVGLFLRAQQAGIGNIKLESITLSNNFRSSPPLIHWFNENFKKIFPKTENINTGAITYKPVFAANTIIADSTLNIHPLINASSDTEAKKITTLIQTLQKKYPNESIAILTRSRNHLEKILAHLRKKQIRYQATEIDYLNNRSVIQDLFALTRAILFPSDRIAWLSILRAPWCGLTLKDLHIIAQEKNTLIWNQLNQEKIVKQLSSDGRKRIAHFNTTFHHTLQQVHRKKLRSLMSETWINLKGPQCVTHKTDLQDANTYFDLLDRLEKGGDILDIHQLKTHIKNIFSAPDSQANHQLQVMTIHKAKGLEFDTVIIPGCEHTTPKKTSQLLLWLERPRLHADDDLILAPIKSHDRETDEIYQYLQRENSLKDQLETIRLLYVAMTRAKKRIHLFGNVVCQEQIKTPVNDSFLKLLWPIIHSDFEKQIPETTGTSSLIQQKKPMGIQRLKLNEMTSPTFQIQPTGFNHMAPESLIWQDSMEQAIGTIIHRILQQISIDGIAAWSQERIEQSKPFWKSTLLTLGVSENHCEIALKTVAHSVKTALSDKRGQWILQPHSQAQSEFSISTSRQNQLQRLIIDRTFVDKNGYRWIIDYKTFADTPQNLDHWLNQEKQKHRTQLENYAKILKKMFNEKIYFGLYFLQIPAWIEWMHK